MIIIKISVPIAGLRAAKNKETSNEEHATNNENANN